MKEISVKLGGEEVKLSASGYLVVLYSELFNSNVFEDFQRIIDIAKKTGSVPFTETTTLYKLAYAMAKHSDPEVVPFEDWLRKQNIMEVPLIADKLVDLWVDETASQSSP